MTDIDHEHELIVSVIPEKCSCGKKILDQDAAEWLVKTGLDRGIDIAFLVIKAQKIREENVSLTARAKNAEAWAKFFVMLGNEMDEEVADFLGQEDEALVSQLSWRDYVAEWRKEREG